jgi:lysophospholipase L1-like esterase
LYANLHANDANLQLNNLGCPGETSGTMISGGICSYPKGNQLDEAVHFLRSHPLRVKLITIDIGANDVDGCLSGGTIDQTCINNGLQAIAKNLTKIVVRLRLVAPFVKIVGMNYYDPFLAAYLQGPSGPALAQQSLSLGTTLNNELAAIYHLGGFKVADVAGAFSTDDFTTMVPLAPGVTVPLDVARICQWTWMCTVPPGPDIHANAAGYAVMAQAFAAQL